MRYLFNASEAVSILLAVLSLARLSAQAQALESFEVEATAWPGVSPEAVPKAGSKADPESGQTAMSAVKQALGSPVLPQRPSPETSPPETSPPETPLSKPTALDAPELTASPATVLAQLPPLPQNPPDQTDFQRPDPTPFETPLPAPQELPPATELLPAPTPNLPSDGAGDSPATITVLRYEVEGSTVFDAAELAVVTQPFVGKVSFSQLLQARSAITQLYVDRGYVTSGAFIPPQTLEAGVVKIQVIEGRLEDVRISGTQRLRPHYIRSRLERAGSQPLNVQALLEGLKLLQIDPLLSSISADLQAGIEPGTSLLDVTIAEADPFSATVSLDNGRSPSVGSFRRKIALRHGNLVGIGDALDLAYSNTQGSNALDLGYAVPLNARNGTLRLAYGRTRSEVIEKPFNILDITAKSIYYEGTYRQPLYQTASEEFALGFTLSRQESQTKLGIDNIGGVPLSPGADDQGRTKISALRFFQEWNQRSSQQVLAARSQFSLGTPWFDATQNSFDATQNAKAPDSNFFSWRGQGQWVRLLAPETLMLVRGDVQLSDRTLVPLEQFGIGGQNSVRGYRQDALLTDNGLLVSGEVRLPIARIPDWDTVVQLAPFIDLGHGWNKNSDRQPEEQTLVGTGLGLIWRQGKNFSARLDWGIPLRDIRNTRNTLQEKGLYFSVNYTPF